MDNFMTDMAQLNPIAPAPVYNQYNPNPFAANIASRTPVAHHKANHDSEGPVGCMSYCRPDEEAIYCKMNPCAACAWCNDGARAALCAGRRSSSPPIHIPPTHLTQSISRSAHSLVCARARICSFCEPPSNHTHD